MTAEIIRIIEATKNAWEVEMSTFLSRDEISELTGRKFKSLQITALRHMGLPFYVNAIGFPVVARSAIDSRSAVAPTPVKAAWAPRVLKTG
ncbi:DUF4224 domain-containing protein [Herminiimonas sp. CN]|uniref:DUF4224 domain-containing protein n=1 Tax=Herminiimonas sp. CN TaxID=1349818 RepID=UPI001EE674A3|nr:DUF4224 domain-containing protein [Herminiimonas sp. CN]